MREIICCEQSPCLRVAGGLADFESVWNVYAGCCSCDMLHPSNIERFRVRCTNAMGLIKTRKLELAVREARIRSLGLGNGQATEVVASIFSPCALCDKRSTLNVYAAQLSTMVFSSCEITLSFWLRRRSANQVPQRSYTGK